MRTFWLGRTFLAVSSSDRGSWHGVRLHTSRNGWCIAAGIAYWCLGVGRARR